MKPVLTQLRPDQQTIARGSAVVKIIACGRRWGKTTLGGVLALAMADHGAEVAWVAPTFANSRPLWRFMEAMLHGHPLVHKVASDRTLRFDGGGRVTIYTGENDVALRGEAFDLCIVDEAARIKEETYTDVIMPTLADRAGRCILISTPKGHNWFWKEFNRGLENSDFYYSYTAPSSANPLDNIKRASELAKAQVSERTYRQEWLAEFVEDGGGVIRGVDKCVKEYSKDPDRSKTYVIGVDWGRTNDATVFVVFCIEDKQVVMVERLLDVAYAPQLYALMQLYNIYRPYVILAEQNSMGAPLVEALQQKELPVQGFTTTVHTKASLIDMLALGIERGDIGLIDDHHLLMELKAYEADRTPTGLLRYGAPPGMHDDCVIACALAYRAGTYNVPTILFEA